jgi:hypothetical protein
LARQLLLRLAVWAALARVRGCCGRTAAAKLLLQRPLVQQSAHLPLLLQRKAREV